MNKLLVVIFLIFQSFYWTDTVATERQVVNATPLERYMHELMSAIKKNLPSESQVDSSESCKVSLKQDRSGYIQELRILECSSGTLSNLVLTAVINASPLPQPDNPINFQEEVTIVYIPEH